MNQKKYLFIFSLSFSVLFLFALTGFALNITNSTNATNQTIVTYNNSSTQTLVQSVIEDKVNWSEVPQFDFSNVQRNYETRVTVKNNISYKRVVAESSLKKNIDLLVSNGCFRVYIFSDSASFNCPEKIADELIALEDWLRDVIYYEESDLSGLKVIGAELLSTFGVNGSGETIVVLDSGVDNLHYETNSSIVGCYNFVADEPSGNQTNNCTDLRGHGTLISGIIVGSGFNQLKGNSVRGIAPNAGLYMLKVLDANGVGTEDNVRHAIEYAVDSIDARIMSLSFGNKTNLHTSTCDTEVFANLTNWAVDSGYLVVVAAGNEGVGGMRDPACASKVLSVGAIDNNGTVPYWSSHGTELDVVAPGVTTFSSYSCSINVTDNCTRQWYAYDSGTSYAAPYVSGIAALYLQKNPSASNQEIIHILKSTTLDTISCQPRNYFYYFDGSLYDESVSDRCNDIEQGHGIVNAYNTIFGSSEVRECFSLDYDELETGASVNDTVVGERGNYSAQVVGATPTATECQLGECLKFDGTNDYLSVDNGLLNNLENGTVCMWYNVDSLASGSYNYLLGASSNPSSDELGMRILNSTSGWFTQNNAGTSVSVDTNTSKNYFICMSWDASNTYVWQDGKLVSSAPNTYDSSTGSRNNTFGDGWDGQPWNGTIDEIIVLETNMSQSLANLLYNYGRGYSCDHYYTPPRVTIDTPSEGVTLLSNETISIDVTVEGSVDECYTNSSYFSGSDYSAPFNFTNSSVLDGGMYTVLVTCTNTGGYGSDTVTFNVSAVSPAKENLVACFSFDYDDLDNNGRNDTALDATGTYAAQYLNDANSTHTNCKINECLTLDGVDAYATIEDAMLDELAAGTVCVWHNTEGITSGSWDYLYGGASYSGGEIAWRIHGNGNEQGYVWAVQNNLGSGLWGVPFLSNSTSQWYFSCLTWNNTLSSVKGYTNATLMKSATNAYASSTRAGNNTIGKGWDGNPWDGLLDEFMVFNMDITQNQMNDLYNSSNGISCDNYK
ncbi:hypothetical protein COT72_04590 [archaeon CG10_big_fil_rev_8_21_14_0_10_43_11]|nr:MAG: hypothetical protein COT72_04590 [archaeon CG10_big_fil_rev_8_21_14_0_10_43_11]